ncbi:MAG: DUF2637 domain-containing protein [Micrococcales bacterium]|nr:DUF2637 domain-containing protein [Micrococcales bacterium]
MTGPATTRPAPPAGEVHGASARGFAAALWPGLWLSGLLAVLAFVLSFSALSAVGVASGIEARLGWAFPLIIDGFILLATWAAWRFRTQGLRGAWYPWAAFVVFSVVSMTGNALHAHPVQVGALMLTRWAATAFSTVPSVALLVASHMLLLIATARRRPLVEQEPHATPVEASEPRPGPAPRPDASGGRSQRGATAPAPGTPTPGRSTAPPIAAEVEDRSGPRAGASRSHPARQPAVPAPSALGSRTAAGLAAVTAAPVPRLLSLVPDAPSPEGAALRDTSEDANAAVGRAPADHGPDLSAVARWVRERVGAGLTVTGPDLVASGLAASTSTARRWLRDLRATSPEVFTRDDAGAPTREVTS